MFVTLCVCFQWIKDYKNYKLSGTRFALKWFLFNCCFFSLNIKQMKKKSVEINL